MIDFLFGPNAQSNNNKKQLRTQINIKEESPLQKFKKQAKKNLLKKQSIQIKQQITVSKQLQVQLGKSQKNVGFLQRKGIQERLGQIQNLVYNAQSNDQPTQYLSKVYQDIQPQNAFIKQGVSETLNNAVTNVDKQIKQNHKISVEKRKVPKTKDDIKQLQKLDHYRLVKIKEGQVKNKVGSLRNQLEDQYFKQKKLFKIDTSDIVQKNYFSMNHPKTKQAQSFIQNVKEQRRKQRNSFMEHANSQQRQKQLKLELEHKMEQRLKAERRQKLRQHYQTKMHQRINKKQQIKQKQDQYKEWLKIYLREKPIEQQKNQQMVMKFIIPQLQERHKKLMQIKAEHRPIDMEQIQQHETRYLEAKRDQQIRRKAERQMKQENDQMNKDQTSRYYKGKYRYLVLESILQQMNPVQDKDIQRSKKERQLAYSDQVKYYHRPNMKNKDIQENSKQFVTRVRNQNGTLSVNQHHKQKTEYQVFSDRQHRRKAQTIDVYQQGLKNLRYVKGKIRQSLINKSELKPKIKLIQTRQNINYLQQIKQQRRRKNALAHSRIEKQIQQLSTANDFQNLKVKADALDQRIKRKEQRYKFVKEDKFGQDQSMQHQYVESIKAKLKLVNQLD